MLLVAERNIFKKLIHREWTKIKNSPFKVGWGAVEPSTSTTIGLTNLLSPGDILLVSWFKFTIDGKNDFYRRELSFSFLWASTIPIHQCLFFFFLFLFRGSVCNKWTVWISMPTTRFILHNTNMGTEFYVCMLVSEQ